MIYAIGIKGYVELREAPKPPVTRVTSAVREILENRPHWHEVPNARGDRYYSSGERKVKKRIRGIVTTGGKFLTSMKARKFSDVTKIHVLPGGVWEVPPEHLPKLLGSMKRPQKEG